MDVVTAVLSSIPSCPQGVLAGIEVPCDQLILVYGLVSCQPLVYELISGKEAEEVFTAINTENYKLEKKKIGLILLL